MHFRNVAMFCAALVVGALLGSLMGPSPVQAVARELIELQRDVTSLLQGQKDLSTQITQDHTVMKTLVEQSGDSVTKLSSTMSGLQKSIQDVQANGGARLDTMSTQVQGVSDNLEEIKSRLGKLNQQLVDLQNTVQSLDAKISNGAAPAGTVPAAGSTTTPTGIGAASTPAATPSADTLYSSGYRDLNTGKYQLARSEFQDYLKYFGNTDLASNAQFYVGESYFMEKNYQQAVVEYDKLVASYPKSFKLAPGRLRKGLALIELGQKTAGVRELREVIKRFPGSEEDRRARARLKELGVAVTAG